MLFPKLLRISEPYALVRKALVQILECPFISRSSFYSFYLLSLTFWTYSSSISIQFYFLLLKTVSLDLVRVMIYTHVHDFSVLCVLNGRVDVFSLLKCTDLGHWVLCVIVPFSLPCLDYFEDFSCYKIWTL